MKCVILAVVLGVAAVANAGLWEVVNGTLATDLIGIGFTDSLTGFTSGDGNGVGPEILKTTDGGHTWSTCNAQFGADILLLDLDATEKTVVVSSVFGELYSTDNGASFKPSYGGGQSQSVRYIGVNGDGGKTFASTGTFKFGKVQGCALSKNGGQTFTVFDAKLNTLARYGAFPTDTTWYVAAGEWPDTDRKAEPLRKSVHQNSKGKFPLHWTRPQLTEGDGYVAQITKTVDGGQTFTTVFQENGTFYFNGIDCNPKNENECCAVGEASGTAGAGARIECTYDGGKTWNRTFWSPETSTQGYSLMEIRWVNETDIWAVGGELNSIAPSGWFLQSTDGGQTWDHSQKPMRGYMTLALSFVDPDHGWADVDNLITQMSGVAKWDPNL